MEVQLCRMVCLKANSEAVCVQQMQLESTA